MEVKMALFDWFLAHSRGDEKSAQAVYQLGGINETAEVKGLDFVAAIETHRKWKERLVAYVQATSTEILDHAVICQDNQCALGKWIYGNGATFCSHLPLFHQLKSKHSQFHIGAAEVVQKVQQDRFEEARSLLLEGDFAKSSRDVQTMLSKLYMEMKAK
jgi:hypothetical protein